MKTEVVGFSDENGRQGEVVLADSLTAPAEQIRIFNEAKVHKRFPAGIRRVTHRTVQDISIAIDLSPTEPTKKSKSTKQ